MAHCCRGLARLHCHAPQSMPLLPSAVTTHSEARPRLLQALAERSNVVVIASDGGESVTRTALGMGACQASVSHNPIRLCMHNFMSCHIMVAHLPKSCLIMVAHLHIAQHHIRRYCCRGDCAEYGAGGDLAGHCFPHGRGGRAAASKRRIGLRAADSVPGAPSCSQNASFMLLHPVCTYSMQGCTQL